MKMPSTQLNEVLINAPRLMEYKEGEDLDNFLARFDRQASF